MSRKKIKEGLGERVRERERLAELQAWRAALGRYGPDGEGPLRRRVAGEKSLGRALKALALTGSESALPQGQSAQAALFVAGKEIGEALFGASRDGLEWQRWLRDISPSKLPEEAFERLCVVAQGASARLGEACGGPIFGAWLVELARSGDAERLERLLSAGVSAEAGAHGSRDRAEALEAAFDARSKACVDALLRFGARPENWEQGPPMRMFGSAHGWIGGGSFSDLSRFGFGGFAEWEREALGASPGRKNAPAAPWRRGRGETPTGAGWSALCERGGESGALAQAWALEESLDCSSSMGDQERAGPRL